MVVGLVFHKKPERKNATLTRLNSRPIRARYGQLFVERLGVSPLMENQSDARSIYSQHFNELVTISSASF